MNEIILLWIHYYDSESIHCNLCTTMDLIWNNYLFRLCKNNFHGIGVRRCMLLCDMFSNNNYNVVIRIFFLLKTYLFTAMIIILNLNIIYNLFLLPEKIFLCTYCFELYTVLYHLKSVKLYNFSVDYDTIV